MTSVLFKFALDSADRLLPIEQAQRGQIGLHCPYCAGPLMVRRGELIAAHYAHQGAPCGQSVRALEALRLPFYDQFELGLTPKVKAVLDELHGGRSLRPSEQRVLREQVLLVFRPLRFWRPFSLSEKALVAYGELPLVRFHAFQNTAFQSRWSVLQKRASNSREDAVTVRLYEAQLKRLLTTQLYFIQVGRRFHKIGITSRTIAERAAEIQRDVLPFLGTVKLEVLGCWPMRAPLELYFKHRYRAFNRPLGRLTEYFEFSDVAPVLNDLLPLAELPLTAFEKDMLHAV